MHLYSNHAFQSLFDPCTVNFPVLDLALFWIISRVLPTHFYKNVTNETKHTCSERAIIEVLKHVKIIVPGAGSIR